MTSITRRQALLGLGALGAVGLLAACTPGAPTPTATPLKPFDPSTVTGDIKVWNFGSQLKDVIANDFQAYVPDATVVADQLALADLEERLLVSLATGTGLPDVASLTLRNSTQFTGTGAFADLRESLGPALDGFADSSLVKGENGEVFGYTIGAGNMGYWLNQQALADKGVDIADFTEWDAVLEAARKLKKDSGGSDYILIQPDGSNGFNNFNAFYHSRGGNWWTAEGEVNEDQDAALQTLKFFQTIVAKEQLAFRGLWTDPAYWNAVRTENLMGFGMNYAIGTSSLPTNVPEQSGKWHLNTWPKWSKDAPEQTGAFGGVVWGVLKAGANPQGGAALASFWLSEAGLPKTIELMGPIAYAPSLDLPVMQKENEYYGGQKVLADLSSVQYPPFHYFRWAKTEEVVRTALEQVQLGQSEPAKALDDIVAGLKRVSWT